MLLAGEGHIVTIREQHLKVNNGVKNNKQYYWTLMVVTEDIHMQALSHSGMTAFFILLFIVYTEHSLQ